MIGIRLKKFRKNIGLKQKEIAEHFNITQSAWAGYEKGARTIPSEILEYLSKEYDLNLNWLFTGHGKMFIQKTAVDIVSETPSEYFANVTSLQKYDYIMKNILIANQITSEEIDWAVKHIKLLRIRPSNRLLYDAIMNLSEYVREEDKSNN